MGNGIHTVAMELPIYVGNENARYFMTSDVNNNGYMSLSVFQWQQAYPAGVTKLHFFDHNGSALSFNFNAIRAVTTDITTEKGINLSDLSNGIGKQNSVAADVGYSFTNNNDYLIIHGQGRGSGTAAFGNINKSTTVNTGDGDDIIVSQVDIKQLNLNMGIGDDTLFIDSKRIESGANFNFGIGNDSFIYNGSSIANGVVIDGSIGNDSFVISGKNKKLDLSGIDIKGFEHIDITGTGNNQLTLSEKNLEMNSGKHHNINGINSDNLLIVDGNAGDKIIIAGKSDLLSQNGVKEEYGKIYDVYSPSTGQDYELWISREVSVILA
ncbi:hypothetical protein AU825_24540 [Salmonella enterica subsp. salamae]|nr:hypothetical protein [Salmonella enterica subsp. salamae]